MRKWEGGLRREGAQGQREPFAVRNRCKFEEDTKCLPTLSDVKLESQDTVENVKNGVNEEPGPDPGRT